MPNPVAKNKRPVAKPRKIKTGTIDRRKTDNTFFTIIGENKFNALSQKTINKLISLRRGSAFRENWPEVTGIKPIEDVPEKLYSDVFYHILRGESSKNTHPNDSKLKMLKGEIAHKLRIRLFHRTNRDSITFFKKIDGKYYFAVHAAFKKDHNLQHPKFFEVTDKKIIEKIENPNNWEKKK